MEAGSSRERGGRRRGGMNNTENSRLNPPSPASPLQQEQNLPEGHGSPLAVYKERGIFHTHTHIPAAITITTNGLVSLRPHFFIGQEQFPAAAKVRNCCTRDVVTLTFV